jgi:hypothetical protein
MTFAALAAQREQLDQLARPVGAACAGRVATGDREPVAHHRDRIVGSMFPPESRATAARRPDIPHSSSGDATARALDDELRALEQEHDRLAISSSVTATMSSSRSSRMRLVSSPGA